MKLSFVLFALSLALLSGCAHNPTPYGKHTSDVGGYYDYKAGPNMVVGFNGNGYTAAADVGRYAYMRADEVCPSGYDLVKSSNTSATNVSGGGVSCNGFNGQCYSVPASTSHIPSVELIIKCH